LEESYITSPGDFREIQLTANNIKNITPIEINIALIVFQGKRQKNINNTVARTKTTLRKSPEEEKTNTIIKIIVMNLTVGFILCKSDFLFI
jgi:hypothetical protein